MQLLANILRSRGLTFRDVHAAGGPSPATLTRLLRGEATWRPEWLAPVAQVLGLTVEELGRLKLTPPPAAIPNSPVATGEPATPAAPSDSKLSHLPPPEEILTLTEAAAFLKCSPDWLYSNKALLRPARLGGRLRYFRSDLVAYLRRSITG